LPERNIAIDSTYRHTANTLLYHC